MKLLEEELLLFVKAPRDADVNAVDLLEKMNEVILQMITALPVLFYRSCVRTTRINSSREQCQIKIETHVTLLELKRSCPELRVRTIISSFSLQSCTNNVAKCK